ncbi:hypothetical protein NEMIN01_0673 [Nematocida minor]|uniref:uncharacterized protein n=1 Tax=Nematocida minor TaxID=1912983 RepID=UPI00221E74A0|nr:uncharacterized protein NEMIN01_0673 [Nematocida minor]KAI5189720.1 hypothetical protein NEMIN01_0673 [Nematocida minor]
MKCPPGDEQNILLDEVCREVLSNTIYYIDTNYHEITKRNKVDQSKVKEKREELETVQRELETIEESIKKEEERIESLRKIAQTERVEGTVDLRELLKKVAERKNDLHSQTVSFSSASPQDVLYTVNFTNTEVQSTAEDKVEALEKIKEILSM